MVRVRLLGGPRDGEVIYPRTLHHVITMLVPKDEDTLQKVIYRRLPEDVEREVRPGDYPCYLFAGEAE